MPSRHGSLRLGILTAFLIGLVGCGGGVPETGTRVELPPNYKEREKEISDGFKAMMKNQATAKKQQSK